MAYVPHSEADVRAMLETVGVGSIEDLFRTIPDSVRLGRPLAIAQGRSEWEVVEALEALSLENAPLLCFAGAGVYDHYTPSAVNHMLLRSEWYTAYTPYQPEVAQGTLQLIYEFQSMVAELFGMETANASMYDAATAAAEATFLAHAIKKDKNGIVAARTVHPHTVQVIATTKERETPLTYLPFGDDGRVDLSGAAEVLREAGCLIVQQPNFLGVVEDLEACAAAAHDADALFIVVADPVAMGVLKSPGAAGADVVVADGQGLGNLMSYGGPGLGLFAAKREYLRLMPGRIAGITVDRKDRRGFVLTLQTREQHIRRDKATSNICTNQALMALAATVHLALLGRQGLRQVAERSLENAHRTFDAVTSLDGFTPFVSGPFFKEFAVRTPRPANAIVASAAREGVLAGVPLNRFVRQYQDDDVLLIAATEKRTAQDIDRLKDALQAD